MATSDAAPSGDFIREGGELRMPAKKKATPKKKAAPKRKRSVRRTKETHPVRRSDEAAEILVDLNQIKEKAETFFQ